MRSNKFLPIVKQKVWKIDYLILVAPKWDLTSFLFTDFNFLPTVKNWIQSFSGINNSLYVTQILKDTFIMFCPSSSKYL